MANDFSLSTFERRAAAILSCVYMSRMFGLFILLPILAPAAEQLREATSILVGLALGIYGLPQIFLQAPLGAWSDRIGRKPVIIGGLLVFIAGCLIAAASDSIYGIIFGRILQGSGAIAAVVMAFAADLTREKQRTKVIAVIGMSIGVAFILAVASGPLFQAMIGLHGVFLISALFALIAGLIVMFALPERMRPRSTQRYSGNLVKERMGFRQVLHNIELMRLNFGTFTLHMILMANFLVLPGLIRDHLGFDGTNSWQLYALILVGSFLLMLPFLFAAERYRKVKQAILFMVVCLAISQGALLHLNSGIAIILLILLFFVAFNYLEANLPSLVSRLCAADAKGVSFGVFMQSQFLGTFFGGLLGGIVLNLWSATTIYLMNVLAAIIWLIAAWGMTQPCFHKASVRSV